MINFIQNKIENVIYSYNPQEFMPIWREGELVNRNAFMVYKGKRLVSKLGIMVNLIDNKTLVLK